MNVLELVQAIKDEHDSTGAGYYKTYILDDVVVKVYENKDCHEADVQKHEELDRSRLLPKMITEFYHNEKWYLVVEKIVCFDVEVRKAGARHSHTDRDEYHEAYYDAMDEVSRDLSDEIGEYEHKLYKKGYWVQDPHGGNFGRFADGKLACLDEGALRKRW